MFRLLNPVQTYAWGDPRYISALLGREPATIAELWMGAHPNAPSRLQSPLGELPLDSFLESSGQAPLPFLFKVLAAAVPLSIQVHPSKTKAEQGFANENAQGISLCDPKRNYKDANHKPEMLYALTDFEALCGFREYTEIIALADEFALESGLSHIAEFRQDPSPHSLAELIRELLSLDPSKRGDLIHKVLETKPRQIEALETQALCRRLQAFFPEDAGCLFPIFLNHIRLAPGSAIFISHSVPHAYLQGAGLELMASSDNVLRGALTPKYIDIDELIEVCSFEPQPILEIDPYHTQLGYLVFSPPVSEFKLMLIALADLALPLSAQAQIALCLSGTYTIQTARDELILSKGEAVFITAGEQVCIKGDGCLAIAGTH